MSMHAAPERPDGSASVSPIRGYLYAEIVIVLALSLGRSGVYAVVDLVRSLRAGPLSERTTALNPSLAEDPWTDLVLQLLAMTFTLAPVALVILLVAATSGSWTIGLHQLGLRLARPVREMVHGIGISAAIGIPGLVVYYAGRALGATVEVLPATAAEHWWTIPVLVLQAVKNAVLEEVIAVAYLVRRLEAAGWGPRSVVAVSALLRGTYHLYQGIGPGLANLVMGVVFAEWFRRTGRTWPLIIAHTVLDVVAFVGYALLADVLPL